MTNNKHRSFFRKLKRLGLAFSLRRHLIPYKRWYKVTAQLPLCQNLTRSEKVLLRRKTSLFLQQKVVTGVQGMKMTAESKIVIAAHACLLILQLDLEYYRGWTEIVVYPGAFKVDRQQVDNNGLVSQNTSSLSGEAWSRGPVILSWDDIERDSFTINKGSQVIIHEFSHKLDMLNGRANGMPPLHPNMHIEEWTQSLSTAYEKLITLVQSNRNRVNSYATTNPAEFFAVVSEYFFTAPEILMQRYPSTYQQLVEFYRQDPLKRIKKMTDKQDMKRRFVGVKRLYGQQALAQFTKAHIVIIGIGGVGSWVVEALARNAIGKLSLIDMDVVAESNINRQLPALSSTIGRNKIDVMAERIAEINPNCQINLIDDFISQENIEKLIPSDCSYVIDCIDSSRIKAALIYWCKRNKIKIMTLGGAGGQIDPALIKISDLSRTEHDPLLSKTRKLLRQDFGFSTNPKRRFTVPCVYSTEHIRYSSISGSSLQDKPDSHSENTLSCAGGLGSSVMVTASFGFMAVSYVLKKLSHSGE